MQSRVVHLAHGRVFGIGTGGVVTQLADAPRHLVPSLVQVAQGGAEHSLGVTPHFYLAALVGLANEVAVL